MKDKILKIIVQQFKDKQDKSYSSTENSFHYAVNIDYLGDGLDIFGCLEIEGDKDVIFQANNQHVVELSNIKFNLFPLIVNEEPSELIHDIEFISELEKEIIPYLK